MLNKIAVSRLRTTGYRSVSHLVPSCKSEFVFIITFTEYHSFCLGRIIFM